MNSVAASLRSRESTRSCLGQLLSWWQPLVLVALIGVLYYEIVLRMAHQWRVDPNFSHGILVPLFSALVVWRERKRISSIPVRPTWAGLPFVVGSLMTCVVGTLGSENFLSRCSLVLLIGALVLYFWGWERLRTMLFPWLFLFVMVPIPNIIFNQITLPLQSVASRGAAALLAAVGVPVLREGNVLQLPAMPLEVAEACSGIRSLLSLGTMAIMYGYLLESKLWRRVVLALMAVPIAVGANALRILGTGLTVQYWDAEKGLGFFHEFSGWVIFIISLIMLVVLHWLLRLLTRQPTETI